jgi:SpoVK/Ycf46/Vps4 family AAA+-type ATPase
MSEKKESNHGKIGIDYLVGRSPNIKNVISELKSVCSMSVTGITNFVVNHENPLLVEYILKQSIDVKQLFNGTVKIDAVEVQHGRPGKGASVRYLDELIYGTYKLKKDPNGDPIPDINEQTGAIRREENGLVTRSGLRKKPSDGGCKDRLLVVNNIDYSLDWCKPEDPGKVDTRALFLLDKFRNPASRWGCGLIIVTNEKLDLPFKIGTVEMPSVTAFEVKHMLNRYILLYRDKKVKLIISETEIKQIVRKLSGLTYNDSCHVLAHCFLKSVRTNESGEEYMDMAEVLKNLRTKINKDLMDDGFGLTQLAPRPWEDYICPEQSNFTYDVKKLLRDFEEVDILSDERKSLANSLKNKKNSKKFDEGLEKINFLESGIDDLRTRMPHIIVLHGQGGVGKSAFPVHLAGLLDMDVWDFNINATHSKWIGQGAEQMRNSLEKISETSHIVIRIDEYDRAMGSTNERGGGMHEAHKQVESEFMNWLQNSQEDNIFVKRNIFVVMTTNHVDNITGPMLRSGRADLVIDIGNFDSESILEAFKTCARRMYNRGVSVTGFKTQEDLQKAIDRLDLEKLSEIAMTKKFTVRDIEMLIIEMGAYKYYFDKYGDERGIPWTTDAFAKVLEHSEGSVKGASTGELKLGDREYFKEDLEDIQVEFGDSVSDVDKLKETKGFQEE